MTNLIVGQEILSRGLLKHADASSLKNSTYDMTVGDIFAVGRENVKERRRSGPHKRYFIEPREMVFVLSKEQFDLPSNVTGLATLRTTLTKNGLHALDVGIIDPSFSGPISTALLNFSDQPVEVCVGQKFFRILFLEHKDVADFHPSFSESIDKETYVQTLEKKAYSEFPKTYLNVPSSDDEFYYRNFWKMLYVGLTFGWLGRFTTIFLGLIVWYLLANTGFLSFFWEKIEWAVGLIP
ncbi:dCTP deaminase domain-containing protein [Tateyamaria sp.]|uniref:dCTP deaminase domain-containing protein n=1 Tax=Tateyamaria sp. TaxID=1929288 RepID=UPI0032A09D4A